MTTPHRCFYRPLLAFFALFAVWPAYAAFTDNNDGTITDGVTGLMWDKCSWGQSNNTTCAATAATTHTWAQALGVAVTANDASHRGYTDWRLPNKNELESLVKIDASSPAIDTTAFPNTVSDGYWSSTTYAPDPAVAWLVYFGSGGTGSAPGYGIKPENYYVRLVRSGQSFGSFDSQADTTAPGYQSAALNAGLTVATLTFDETLVNNLANIDPLLKANVTFASDGTTFNALAAGDVVALSGSTVTVTFATALTGSTNKLEIAANSLKDAAGNVLASAVTTAALDAAPPAFQSAALNAGLTVATLTFDEAPVNNLANIDPLLKANITFAADGMAFNALAAGDAVALSGSTLTVTFASALIGATNKLKIAANSLKDAASNVLASAVTTAALDATDTTPGAFSFTAATNAALSTATESAAITVTGINAASAISIANGQYALSTDSGGSWGAYTAGAGTVNLNDQVKVKLTSSNSYSTAASATLTIGGENGTFSVTTPAAPAPAPSYDPGPTIPPAPTEINAQAGAETTLTGATPVNAAPGSTLVIPAGVSVSGVAITLAAPAAGAAAQAVTIKIGGNTLTVTPTGANVVVTLKTVTLNGVPTLVLAVSHGTVTVSATPGQPLVAVGSDANAVVVSSTSAGATVIAGVDKSTGVTSLTLPKSASVSDADASVNMTIGGQDVNVQPSGGNDVVVTLKTVTVNGVSTQVVSVTGGSATVTSRQPNQPLLAVGSGSNAIVVTADTAGTAATSTVNVGTGETFIAVSNGVVTLPTNAFAEAGNGFAAIKDGKIYAGEIAVLNSAGKITGVRLGSQSGAAGVGDPIKAAGAAGLTMNVTVPHLKGKVARVSDSQDFGDMIVASLGAGFTSKGQNSSGVLSLTFPGGGNGNALPLGEITVDTSRADGISIIGNGKVEVVKSGVIARFAPTVADPAQLAGQVAALDKNAGVSVNDYGVLQATVHGVTYALQPAWGMSKASGGAAGLTLDADDRVVYQDGVGNVQTLYPAFADFAQLVAAFKSLDANTSATGHDDGTVTAKLLGVTYTLTPDYALIPVPVEHAKDAWWLDGRKVYVKTGDGKSAQGFNVK